MYWALNSPGIPTLLDTFHFFFVLLMLNVVVLQDMQTAVIMLRNLWLVSCYFSNLPFSNLSVLSWRKKKVLARLNIPLEIIDQSCGKIRVHMFSYEFVCNQNPSTSPSIFLILIQLLYNPLSIFTTLPPHTDTNIIITTRFPPKSSLSKIVCFPLCKCQKHHAAIVVKDNDNMDPQLRRGRWDCGTVV